MGDADEVRAVFYEWLIVLVIDYPGLTAEHLRQQGPYTQELYLPRVAPEELISLPVLGAELHHRKESIDILFDLPDADNRLLIQIVLGDAAHVLPPVQCLDKVNNVFPDE